VLGRARGSHVERRGSQLRLDWPSTIPAEIRPQGRTTSSPAGRGNAVPERGDQQIRAANSTANRSRLAVSALSVPTTGGAGGTITLTDTTEEPECGGADATITRYYLSTNTTFEAADTVLGRAAQSLRERGQPAPLTAVTILPRPPQDVLRHRQGRRGQCGSRNGRDQHTRGQLHRERPRTLAVSAMSVSHHRREPGATITVTDTTKNQGGGDRRFRRSPLYYLSTKHHVRCCRHGARRARGSRVERRQFSSGSTAVTIPAATRRRDVLRSSAKAGRGQRGSGNGRRTKQTRARTPRRSAPTSSSPALTVPATSAAGATIIVSDTTQEPGRWRRGGNDHPLLSLGQHAARRRRSSSGWARGPV